MLIRKLNYRGKKYKVVWSVSEHLCGEYDPNTNELRLNPNQTKEHILKTIFHELFHVICTAKKVKVSDIGEESVCLLCEEFITILKKNKNLLKLINNYF
jgi:predicted SprT family Zn-dependent metalloprotease